MIEFWQGRQNRLHDRIVFKKVGEEADKEGKTVAKWEHERL